MMRDSNIPFSVVAPHGFPLQEFSSDFEEAVYHGFIGSEEDYEELQTGDDESPWIRELRERPEFVVMNDGWMFLIVVLGFVMAAHLALLLFLGVMLALN